MLLVKNFILFFTMHQSRDLARNISFIIHIWSYYYLLHRLWYIYILVPPQEEAPTIVAEC